MKKSLISVLVIIAMIALALCGCGKKEKEVKQDAPAFKAPQDYVSVVQVKINPTINLYLNAEDVILAVEYVNADAQKSYSGIENKLVGSKIADGVNAVMEKAQADGYLKENKEVTIDVIEAKKAERKVEILTVAKESAETFITEKKIEAKVVLTQSAQKEVDDKAAADKAAADKAAADKAAADKAAAEKAAADKAAADKAAADKAAADKAAADKEKKNPIKNLKKGVKYSIFKPEGDELLTGIFITFNTNGRYSYSMAPYLCDEFGEGESVIYNGKTYYLSGGGGGAGAYSLTTEKITLTEAYNMVLTMTVDGKLVVEQADPNSDFFKVGDILTAN